MRPRNRVAPRAAQDDGPSPQVSSGTVTVTMTSCTEISFDSCRIYRDKGRQFPVLTERVFTQSGASPEELIDYKLQRNMDDADAGRIFVLERTDNPTDQLKTRLFFVWLSPALVGQFQVGTSSAPRSKHALFHSGF